MTTMRFETFVTCFQRAGEVKPGDRSPASLPMPIIQTDHDRRTVKSIDNARGDNSDDAGMPPLCSKHDRTATLGGEIVFLNLLDRLLQNLLLHRLTRAILLLEKRGDLNRLRLVGVGHHLIREPGMPHSPTGVEPRREQEAHMKAVEALPSE